jgi:AcrR family transcriptional regulator
VPKVSAEHKDAVRRRIMDAALVCLARNDFQGVTTRELLAEAELSTGTFYNYFPSKEHLFESLAEELLADDIERLRSPVDGHDAGTGLLRFLRDYLLADPVVAATMSRFRGEIDRSGDAREAIERLNAFVVREFTPLVARAQTDAFLRDDLDAEAAVELFDIVWDGLGRRQASGSFQTSYRRVGETLLQILLHGVLVPGTDVSLAST